MATLRRRAARSAGVLLLAVASLCLLGMTTQLVMEAADSAAHPAPGELVDVGDGRRIHLNVMGEHNGGPTIVLEVGGSLTSSAWAWLQPELAEYATVVSYDRANYGWSDPVTRKPTAEAVVTDLHAALAAEGLSAPYLLVGHSIGGYYAEEFAARYPNEMAGLVLLDPTPVGWATTLPADMVANIESQQGSVGMLRLATSLGITRLWNPMAAVADGLPQPARSELLAATMRRQQAEGIQNDTDLFLELGERMPNYPDLGNLPVCIVSAGITEDPAYDSWEEAQWAQHRELIALSTDAHHVVIPDANHISLLTNQHHAREVASHIHTLYEEVRQ